MILVIESLNKEASKTLANNLSENKIEIIDCETSSIEDILKIFLTRKNIILLNLFGLKDWTNSELLSIGSYITQKGIVIYLTKRNQEDLLKLYSKEDVSALNNKMAQLQLCAPILAEEF